MHVPNLATLAGVARLPARRTSAHRTHSARPSSARHSCWQTYQQQKCCQCCQYADLKNIPAAVTERQAEDRHRGARSCRRGQMPGPIEVAVQAVLVRVDRGGDRPYELAVPPMAQSIAPETS